MGFTKSRGSPQRLALSPARPAAPPAPPHPPQQLCCRFPALCCVGVFGNEIFPAELQNEAQGSQLLE